MHEDRAGGIWIGSSGGLSLFDGGRFVTLGAQSGVPVQNITAIAEDHAGHLWITVKAGLVRLTRDEFLKGIRDPAYRPNHRLFTRSDGVPGSPLWSGYPAVARGPGGTLWFVTSNGVGVVDPARLPPRATPPGARVESVTADNSQFYGGDHVELPPRTASVQIDYTGFDFASPERLRFRYRLEGFDEDWVDAGTRRQAFYTNLSPGTYRFQVIAGDGERWSEAAATRELVVLPTFYQSGWFRTAVVLALVLALAATWWLRMTQLRQRLAAVLAERARIAREIHDTLLQSLIGVSLQVNDLGQKLGPSPAREQLERLRREVEYHIRDARNAIWDIQADDAERPDFVTAMRAAAERMMEGQVVEFAFAVNGTPRPVPRQQQDHLLRIGQEALNNAMRHAGADSIRLEVDFHPDTVALRVVDDGRGLAVDDYDTEKHWGLRIMQERAQRIGGRFHLKSQPGDGTQVEVVAPLAA
jgi:signal transduction histidine kinase